jgi:TP53 regulating kinase-like protein
VFLSSGLRLSRHLALTGCRPNLPPRALSLNSMEPQDHQARPSKRAKTTSSASPERPKTTNCAKQGAEGKVYERLFLGRPAICKERFAKKYRHPSLDTKLRQTRMLQEARCLVACSRKGIDVPQVYFVDEHTMTLYIERIDGWTVKEYLNLHADDDEKWTQVAVAIGTAVATMHDAGIVHGDLTTSNMMIRRSVVGEDDGSSSSSSSSGETKSNNSPQLSLTLIDFGLGSQSVTNPEDRAVDLYVLERAMASTHPGSETRLVPVVIDAYRKACDRGHFKTMDKLAAERQRGRKRMAYG